MIPKPLNEIAEPDIQELKAAGIQEGKNIEYKGSDQIDAKISFKEFSARPGARR